jgi:hypothetical protein
MAATKAQLAVWGLIAGLSVWGLATLSRVKLPDTAPDAVASKHQPAAEALPPLADATPTTIPQFPFPDDLVAAEPARREDAPQTAGTFAEISVDAIPQISSLGENLAAPEEGETQPQLAMTTEAPPIPMPSRPMAARPAEAVSIAEAKTLYVVADMLNIRAAPSTTGLVLQKVPQGFAVAPRQRSNEWIGFLMQDGSMGWMRTDYLSDTMPRIEKPDATSGNNPLNLMM